MANKGNFIEAEGLVKKLNEAFTDHVKVVQMSVQTVKSLNDEYKKLPSDYAKGLKDVAIAQEKAVANTNKLIEVKKLANVKTTEEIVNNRALAQSADRQAKATSALVGAYANLNAKHQQSAKNLQDLIVRGRSATQTQSQYNRELRQAQKEFNTLNQRILSADRAVGRFNRNVGNYPTQALRGIKDLIGAFGIVGGVSLFALITKDIISTGKELQGLNNALMLVTETQANFAEQQAFLQRISEAYGLEIQGLTKQFTQFYVSAKDKASGREIQQIFESVSKAGASMGLSVQSQERAFLALNQMMSKGTIQAEELRGQLGEALPGAFGIMAKAVGVTEKELAKMMKAGELLASDVLPKFAKQLEITYGIENIDRIETMTTATNRLSNAWTKFVESITRNDGVISKSLIKTFNVISDIVDGIRLLTMSEKELNDEMKKNVVSKRVDEYKEYLKTLDLTNKAVVAEQQAIIANDLEKNKLRRAEIDLLKQRRAEIVANQNQGGIIGTGRDINKENQEIEAIDLKIRANEVLNQVYVEQAEALELMTKEANELNTVEGESIIVKREKLQAIKLEAKETESVVQWLKKQIALNEELKESTNGKEVRAGLQKNIDFLKLALANLEGEVDPLQDNAKKALEEFSKYAESLGLKVEKIATDWRQVFDDWSGVAVQAIDLVSQAQDNAFVKRMNQLEREKDIALQFAGESATAREEIERQYEAKRQALEKKRFEQEKRTNIIRAIIDTAGAVVEALPNIPLSIAVGALGAIQIGLIASQQYPEFYKGTDDAPEGWAWTQEQGRELITDRFGKVKDLGSDKGAKLTPLKKGDKVYTADQTQAMMFNNELNSILLGKGINPSVVVNNDNEELKSEIRELGKIIKNKSSITVIEDKRGKRIFEKSQSSRKELVNNRIKIKGSDV